MFYGSCRPPSNNSTVYKEVRVSDGFCPATLYISANEPLNRIFKQQNCENKPNKIFVFISIDSNNIVVKDSAWIRCSNYKYSIGNDSKELNNIHIGTIDRTCDYINQYTLVLNLQ